MINSETLKDALKKADRAIEDYNSGNDNSGMHYETMLWASFSLLEMRDIISIALDRAESMNP